MYHLLLIIGIVDFIIVFAVATWSLYTRFAYESDSPTIQKINDPGTVAPR